MAQPFTLKFYDGSTTINFLGTTFTVADGGFDISMPRTEREYAQTRKGFYVPTRVDKGYREATIIFEITGTDRSNILGNLQTLERMLERLDFRERLYSGNRAEIQYAWDDSVSITYFEVYGGELEYPDNLLSVEYLHRTKGSNLSIPGIKLKLYLSAYGYGVSIHSNTLTEVPLLNGSVGAKQTGGITIKNPGAGNYNYVEIAAADTSGQGPMITKISLQSGSTYETWNMLFMGLCSSENLPTKMLYEDSELGGFPVGDSVAGGSGGTHLAAVNVEGTAPSYPVLGSYGWALNAGTKGMFYAFVHGYGDVGSTTNLWAVGVDDYAVWNIRKVGNFYRPKNGQAILPVGAIQLPPFNAGILNFASGGIEPDLEVGFFLAREESPFSVNLDFMYLLPINDGLRVIVAYGDTTVGTTVDDDWSGNLYLLNGSNQAVVSHFGVASPLRLLPGKTQRIYFNAVSYNGSTNERNREFTVRLYAVPTYRTLAL